MTSLLDRPLKPRTFAVLGRRRRAADNVATALVTLAMLLALTPLAMVLCSVIAKGLKAIASTTWWTQSQAGATDFAAGGGAYQAIIGSLLQGLVCAVIAIPIGIMLAIYLVEYGGGTTLGRLATFMVDILSGVPSIVAALFIYALCVATLGLPRSEFVVALALVLLMLPVIVRATEEMLRIVPIDLREASYALGIPKWKTIARIVIPTGLSGIITGIMLAVARVMGETAPLLILVGYCAVDELQYLHGVHGVVTRPDVRPDIGRCGPQPGAHGSVVGCGINPHSGDRRHQCRGPGDRENLCPQEVVGRSTSGQEVGP